MTSGQPRSAHVAALIDGYDAGLERAGPGRDRVDAPGRDRLSQPQPEGESRARQRCAHIGAISARGRRSASSAVGDDLAASEWTARAVHADGRQLEWDGV